MQLSIKKLLAITAFVAFSVWFVRSAYIDFTHVETNENLSAVDWLPQSASNISYYKSYQFTAYEFDISEAEFCEWSRWDTAEITEPVKITRYTLVTGKIPDIGTHYSQSEIDAYSAAIDQRRATIEEGLYYGHTRSNGGGVWVGYDRGLGRAFFQSSPR